MPIKIAVPDNKIYEFLYKNYEKAKEQYDIELYKVDEERAGNLFRNNRVDLALLSPLTYAEGVENHDFRIVPGPCMVLENFTDLASIYFKPGIRNIKQCLTKNPKDYLMIMGKILLSERYGIEAEPQLSKKDKKDILAEADTAILYEKSKEDEISIDISEAFFDTFEMPLINAIWVCRNDEFEHDMHELIHTLADDDLSDVSISEIHDGDKDYSGREGEIHKHWHDDFEEVLAHTIEILFYRQYVPEISDVKILGRD